MIRFAKSMAHPALAIGATIGAFLTATLMPPASACAVAAPAPMVDTCIAIPPDAPAGYADFVTHQCQVHETLFGDGSQPGMVFGFEKDIVQPGKSQGTAWDGRTVTLEAVMVVPVDVKALSLDLHNHGVVLRAISGRLVGPIGSVPFSGMFAKMTAYTGDANCFLLVQETISNADLDTYAQTTRNQAGFRVLDVDTFVSYPLESVTRADGMTASQSDLATYYAHNVNGASASTETPDCVKRAQAQYQLALKTSADLLQSCLIHAALVLAGCTVVCTVGGLVGTPIAGLICLAGCSIQAGWNLIRCANDDAIRLRAAAAALTLALAGCGVFLA